LHDIHHHAMTSRSDAIFLGQVIVDIAEGGESFVVDICTGGRLR